jgi:endogenous inhibitor of DNA gyrase (YacG/DUF329 family)
MINVHCPICGKEIVGEKLADLPSFPFCSPRCRTVDLGRWLGEAYRIPEGPDKAQTPNDAPDDMSVP